MYRFGEGIPGRAVIVVNHPWHCGDEPKTQCCAVVGSACMVIKSTNAMWPHRYNEAGSTSMEPDSQDKICTEQQVGSQLTATPAGTDDNQEQSGLTRVLLPSASSLVFLTAQHSVVSSCCCQQR